MVLSEDAHVRNLKTRPSLMGLKFHFYVLEPIVSKYLKGKSATPCKMTVTVEIRCTCTLRVNIITVMGFREFHTRILADHICKQLVI